MANNPQLTKRVQIDRTQALMLGLVIGASFISVFSLMAAKTYFSQANYLNRIASKKEIAVKQLKANKDATAKLVTSYKSFSLQNPNLLGGNTTGNGEHDGDNGRLVLDALPSKYDFPALATSLEKLLKGYTINSITGNDVSATQTTPVGSRVVDMPFTLDISSDSKGVQTLLTTFEKSIRPFQIQTLTLSGTNNKLAASIGAKTYYQPEKDLKIVTEVVK